MPPQEPPEMLEYEGTPNAGSFHLLPVWGKISYANHRSHKLLSDVPAGTTLFDQLEQEEEEARCNIKEKIFIHPFSSKRVLWDVANLLLVMYDMAVIPLQFFDPDAEEFLTTMTWVTRLFWTGDVFVSFLKGYLREDGSIEMSPPAIARAYLTSWFALDMLMVSTDWMEIIWAGESGTSYARFGRTSRSLRIIRMLRLLRVLRIRSIMTFLVERFSHASTLLAIDIGKFMLVLLGLAHILACLWYGIGARDKTPSWVDEYNYRDAPLADRYVMSLQWALAQFSGGMDEVTAMNYEERLYAIGAWLVTFIAAMITVSNLTSTMTQMNIIGSNQAQGLATLKQFLSNNGISQKLILRVQRNAQHAVAAQQRFLSESRVRLFHDISEHLRAEVHFEMYTPMLRMHQFFSCYIDACPEVMQRVCHTAAATIQVCVGDVLFHNGEIPNPPRVVYVASGTLEYEYQFELVTALRPTLVKEGTWMCEPTLWTSWRHRGKMSATSDCRLFTVDAAKFQEIASLFEHRDFDPKAYAVHFVSFLNRKADVSDLTTVPYQFRQRGYNVWPLIKAGFRPSWH